MPIVCPTIPNTAEPLKRFVITSHNEGDTLAVGDTITWTNNGAANNVDVYIFPAGSFQTGTSFDSSQGIDQGPSTSGNSYTLTDVPSGQIQVCLVEIIGGVGGSFGEHCCYIFQGGVTQSLTHKLFTQIESDANGNKKFENEIDYEAELYYQSSDVCYARVDSAQQCVFLDPAPEWTGTTQTVSTNADLLSKLTSGSSNVCYDLQGQTFQLTPGFVQAGSNVRVKNGTITPTSSAGTFSTVTGNSIFYENVVLDYLNFDFDTGFSITGADFEFVRSEAKNINRPTSTNTFQAFLVKGDRADFRCSNFANFIGTNAAARAIRWADATIEGGYVVNNTFNNIQATNANSFNPSFVGNDGDAMVAQGVTFTVPLKIYGNRGTNMGKRFVKIQNGDHYVQSNDGNWQDLTGPLGSRSKRAMYADLSNDDSRFRNNIARSNYQYTDGESHGYFFAHTPSTANKNWTCNTYEINHTANNLDYGFTVFNRTNGTPAYPPGQFSDNVVNGSGTIDWAFWDRNTPLDNFSGYATVAGDVFVPTASGVIRNT